MQKHIKKVLKKLEKKSLSGQDIINGLNGNVKVITYQDIRNYDNLDDLLHPYNQVVILYETSEGYGHWVCLYSENGKITFFDSYGLKPDEELKFIPKYFRKENDTDYPLLTYLLYQSGYKVEYNQHRLQKSLRDVNTCGRHCIVRLKYKEIPIDTYAKILRSFKPYNPDNIVTMLTANI